MCVARGPRCPWTGQAGRPGPPGPSAPPAVAGAWPGTGISVKIMRLNKKKLLLNEKKAIITENIFKIFHPVARHGEIFSEKCEKKFLLSRKYLGTISPCDQEAEIMRGSRLPGTEVAAEAL